MKYYRITLSSKIANIKEGLFPNDEERGRFCGYGILNVAIPNTLSTISDMAFYECKDIQSITVGNTTYRRPEGKDEVPIKLNGKTVIEKIGTEEADCTILPFELSMPLCPEDMVSPNQ